MATNVDASRVTVGAARATGAVFVAPAGTTHPKDAVAALANTYKCIGYTSDEGLSISESSNNDAKRAWEGLTEVYNVKTEYSEQISFTPIECNEQVAKIMWGDDAVEVGENGALTIKHHGRTMEPVECVIETVPREGIVNRRVCTIQLTERDNQTLNGADLDGRTLTFSCLADDDGTTMTEYIAFTA